MGITPRQFNQLQNRLAHAKTAVAPVRIEAARRPTIILGIDPSLRGTGYGLIRWSKRQPVALAHGHIGCPSGWIPSRCLVRTAEVLRQVILEHRPEVCVVEALFYAQNLQTALVMGEARGAILLTAAEAGLQIYEMAARKVKLAIAGHGAAHKTAVAKMVQRLLQLPSPPQADAADALALALAYSQELHRVQLTVHRQI